MNKLQIIYLIPALFLIISCNKRDLTPCDDPDALNYNPRATVNDGSCEYPQFNIKPELITTLSKVIEETSGLLFFEEHVWTHNDRSGENKLYSINFSNGAVGKIIEVTNAINKDWEDITEDDHHIYIGDFGNNEGNRTDLKIYKIVKNQINITLNYQQVTAEKIDFHYPDQDDFRESKDHNWDCESMIHFNDKLYLFSKHRLDNKCNIYRLPSSPGNYSAEIISSFYARGRVTGADISPNQKNVTLLGYNKNSDVFLWILNDFKGDDFFSGKKTFVNLGPFSEIGQAEGICFISDKEILISSEAIENLQPKLYKVGLEDLLK